MDIEAKGTELQASDAEPYMAADSESRPNGDSNFAEEGSVLQIRKALPRQVNAQALAQLNAGTVSPYIPAVGQTAILDRVAGTKRDRSLPTALDMLLDSDEDL
jgi:hypothetical protein